MECVVGVHEEDRRATIAPLRHMMQVARHDQASKAPHALG